VAVVAHRGALFTVALVDAGHLSVGYLGH
jgi:hypothetical protein